jgi:hypothetical protein
MLSRQEREDRLIKLRNKKYLDEVNSLQEKPEINLSYKFKSQRVPIAERKIVTENLDDVL